MFMSLRNLHQTTTKKALFFKLLILSWPFYQLSRLPFIRLYLVDLVVFLAIVFHFKDICHSGLSRIGLLLKPLSFFLTAATLSLIVAFISGSGSFIAVLYLARLFLYSSLLFISLPKKASLSLLNISFFIIPVLGILQYLFFPDLRFLKAIGYDDHYFRLTFPFLDPNFTGAVLSFISIFSLKNIKKPLAKVLLGLSLVALALTFSRISYLSFLVGLLYLIFKNKKLRLPLFLATLSLGTLVFLAPKPFGEGVNLKRTFSITSRISNLQQGFKLFVDNPFTGVGYNTLPFSPPQHSSAGLDNSFVFILATTGTVGFISFVYLLFKAWGQISNLYLKAALLSLVLHSFSNNTLFYAPITILIFLSLNLSVRKLP